MNRKPLKKKSIKKPNPLELVILLEGEIKLLKNMINTTIWIAYDKWDEDAIDYLINERNHSDFFIPFER